MIDVNFDEYNNDLEQCKTCPTCLFCALGIGDTFCIPTIMDCLFIKIEESYAFRLGGDKGKLLMKMNVDCIPVYVHASVR